MAIPPVRAPDYPRPAMSIPGREPGTGRAIETPSSPPGEGRFLPADDRESRATSAGGRQGDRDLEERLGPDDRPLGRERVEGVDQQAPGPRLEGEVADRRGGHP